MEGNNDVMNIFYIEDRGDKFLVKVDLSKTCFDTSKITGSWAVFEARVMGLSYANYLRMCRDEFGAKICGKNCLYPVAYFDNTDKVKKLIKFLNKRAAIATLEKEKILKGE